MWTQTSLKPDQTCLQECRCHHHTEWHRTPWSNQKSSIQRTPMQNRPPMKMATKKRQIYNIKQNVNGSFKRVKQTEKMCDIQKSAGFFVGTLVRCAMFYPNCASNFVSTCGCGFLGMCLNIMEERHASKNKKWRSFWIGFSVGCSFGWRSFFSGFGKIVEYVYLAGTGWFCSVYLFRKE